MKGIVGQVAMVTGGSAGIGRGLALAFAKAGASVAILDIDAAGGGETLALIEAAGGRGMFVAGDVSDAADVAAFVEHTVDVFGSLAILINNAGITHPRTGFETFDYEVWRRILAVNLDGPFLASRAAVGHMKTSGKGVIVNLGSVLGDATFPGKTAYTTSKAAVVGLTKSMALDLAGFGIRVNCIIPGSVDSDMMWHGLSGSERVLAEAVVAEDLPIGRVGTPQDIANTALFLASDAAAFVTGATLVVDGGLLTKVAASR